MGREGFRRASGDRQYHHRAAKNGDEIPPSHSEHLLTVAPAVMRTGGLRA
jgi:hypothetical protein